MIIQSLLDTDLYKLTMQQAVLMNYPTVDVRYEFHCRNGYVDLRPCKERITEEIKQLCRLRFQPGDLTFLRETGLFNRAYLDALASFQLSFDDVHITDTHGQLGITVQGPWWNTILFEVPILAIVNECYFKWLLDTQFTDLGKNELHKTAWKKLKQKCQILDTPGVAIRLMEFGTRRRFSRTWQERVVETLLCDDSSYSLVGTSNVYLAKQFNLSPMGTMAHEWLQAHQALAPLPNFQRAALERWMLTYRGKLGIALTDCIGIEAFCDDFDLLLAKAYDGVRHDSGDPYLWGDRMLTHYHSLGIKPKDKTLVFSDGLNVPKALDLTRRFSRDVQVLCGIGTDLTNDFDLHDLKIVMKMTHCNHQAVAKITDEPGKAMKHDPDYLAFLARTFHVKL
jgi:nicotinate phosphoribosyltransferase